MGMRQAVLLLLVEWGGGRIPHHWIFSLSHYKVLLYVIASPCGPLKDQILQKVENPVKSALV